ncbi:hypothetical protein AURDEDRAFT_115198 [Auricularia subglabra TFB-10046 SS5]|nr:hypothetical protein AURDEDRAFT_115198 [Auricularia subglabra TFB-10046 SS5]
MDNVTAAERSAATPQLGSASGSQEQLPTPPPPSTPPRYPSDVLVVEPDGTRYSEDAPPESLHPLTTMAPSTPHSHAGLPIGRSRSISSIGRARSDSVNSSSRHGHTSLNAANSSGPSGSPTQTPTRPALPGGAAALIIPSNPSRISVTSLSGVSPVSPTQSSATHIGTILAPASFFRPARPSQQGQHHQHNTISSARSVPHSIGPAPTGSTSPRNSLALPTRPMMPGTSITNSPRKSGAIPDGAIPLTSFAARRASIQSKRMSHGSTSASDTGDDVFGGTFHSSSIVVEEDPSVQHARPMASREPLLTPHEQLSAQQQQQPSPTSQGMRGSLERIFRRSFSGESLKHVGGSPRTPKTAQTPRSGNPLVEEPDGHEEHADDKSEAPSRHPRFAPLPPRVHASGVVAPSWMQPVLTSSGRPVRNYERHRGANRFFLRGKLMLGGDLPWAFLGTLFVYCVIVAFWMGTTCVYWWRNLSPALAVVGAYMALVTLSSLLATAFRDPGILPRDLDLDAPLPMGSDSDSAPPTPLPREIRVRDEVVRTKYCVTCKTYRPPRSSHCRNCDNCVDGCDHHCPWVNNCVGRRNYGSFITCLVCAVVSLVLIIITSAIHLNVLSGREHLNFESTLRDGFGSAVTFVSASIVIWPVSILMGYHVRLLYLNTTTIEQVRNKAHKSLGAGAGPLPPNPFTYGRWYYNMAYLLCRPPGYSWIAADEIAAEDKRVRPPVDEEEDEEEEAYDDEQRWSRSVGA